MPPIKGQMFRYTEADMEAAVDECRRGLPTSTAAKKFGVPRVTLLNKVKGKTPIKRKMGRTCYLTEETEAMLVKWVKMMVKQGFPIGKENLLDSVKKIVEDLNIEVPFKGGRPGKKWYSSFLKRHPDLIVRQPQNFTSSRASVTTTQLKNWFEEVNLYLEDNDYKKILNEPQRVFNMDETAFFLNPKGNKVLAAKGEKLVYQQVNSDEKECYTVLLGGNAAGNVLPPMVIFKYERIPKELSMSVPKSWGIGRSESGWMTMETFYEYICNIFNKWLDDNNIQRPVILFIDGHTSHLSFHLSTFCSENGIILVAIFPNATHLLQPMDVAVFRSLKGAWKTAVHSWRLNNIDNPIFRKVHFCPLLNKVLQETLSPEVFNNGFRKCGLLPWNPDEVCCDLREPTEGLSELQRMAKIKELETGLKFLDKYIEADKISQFIDCDESTVHIKDINLFKFYKHIKELLKQNYNNLPLYTDLASLNNQLQQQTSISELISPLPYHNDDINTLNVFSTPNKNTSQNCHLLSTPQTQNIIPENNSLQSQVEVGEEGTSTSSMVLATTSRISLPQEGSLLVPSNMVIPSPFKRALFWPTPKQNSKRRKKEKIPSVITSVAWQKYHANKERKKIHLEEEKKRKAQEREEKKKVTEEARRLKTAKVLKKRNQKTLSKKSKTNYYSSSTEEEWEESGNSMDDISDECNNDERNDDINREKYQDISTVKQSDYIIVKFPGKKRFHKYVCIVQKVTNNNNIEVMAMKVCDQSKTIFIENDKDISIISFSQIIEVLDIPKMIIIGDRIKYKFAKPLDVDG